MRILLERPIKKSRRGYDIYDGMAVEIECAEFLYGLVRLLKPELVIESGTGRGAAAHAMGAALAKNESGRLVTYEPLELYRDVARRNLGGLPVEVQDGSSLDWGGRLPDLVFLDSGPDYRHDEIEYWLVQGQPFMLAVHDAQRNYGLPTGLMIPSPRGLWVGTIGEDGHE